MKKCLLMVLLLSAALGQVVMAQLVGAVQEAPKYDLSSTVPLDKKLVKGRLPNGLTYYIRANKKPENRVQFRLVTNAGSVLEDESQRGLAHFTEHMAFNGIKGYPHNELISTLQKYGIEFGREINAYTSFDETVYYVNLPSDDTAMLNMGYRILDGWSSGLLFDAQELEEERGVIHEEWRGGQGAGERLRDKTWPIMLRGSQYAERMPIGLERVIMGFKRDDIVRFYNDWYRTDLQAVVIVGDIDPVEVEAKIKEVFGGRAKVQNPKPRNTFDVPANKEPLIAIATDHEATSTSMVFYWKHGPIPQGTVVDYRTSLLYSFVVSMINDRVNELCDKPESPMTGAGAG
ncbi:MAG: insulinase family protein, partial [Bacteroidales bacterium]|nr:insulinase family protein [Candidatus Colimorpha onthohippi]